MHTIRVRAVNEYASFYLDARVSQHNECSCCQFLCCWVTDTLQHRSNQSEELPF